MHRSWHGVAPVGPSHPADYPELDAVRRGVASESLFDVFVRVSAFVRSRLASDLNAGRNVLVVSHSNALRALVCLLEAIPPGCVDTIEVPMTAPRAFRAAEVLTALSAAESARLIQPEHQEVNS
jgi:bisphosphoglycerate-dependent phosphoglycerate mutase